ncbi:MAG: glycosyltransferase [Steroidobacteraceae bacterium]|nr:glycosyltransferase [Steroidobacteraceae bacterium]
MKTQQYKLLSIIIPVGARRSELQELYRQYKAGVEAIDLPYEFIFVLDGPLPDASRSLDELMRAGEPITVVTLTRSFGASAAINAGFERCSGDAILTLPAYHQVEPQDVRKLTAALASCDVAIGRRWPRRGSWFDRTRRLAFHRLVNFVTGSRFRDLGCGARALRRQVLEEIDLYGDQHRFLAILAMRLGFRVAEIDVRQSPLDRFARVYRPREYARHALDVVSIFFLVRFTKKPLRFFGMFGAATFSIGAILIAALSVDRLVFGHSLADRPALLLAVLLVVLGMQIFALGLLGELIIFTHARGMKDYRVEEVIQYPDKAPAAEAASEAEEDAAHVSSPVDAGRSTEMRRTTPPAVVA